MATVSDHVVGEISLSVLSRSSELIPSVWRPSAWSPESGDRTDVVQIAHADEVAGVRGVHDGVVADVDAHVVQVAVPEHQVAGLQIGPANRSGVGPLPLGVVAQSHAVDRPGGEGQAGAVVAFRPGVGENVRLADQTAGLGGGLAARVVGVLGRARAGAQRPDGAAVCPVRLDPQLLQIVDLLLDVLPLGGDVGVASGQAGSDRVQVVFVGGVLVAQVDDVADFGRAGCGP